MSKKDSKKAGKEDDMSWVFDSLVDFLSGPLWNSPIMSFIETKSMFFEPGEDNQKVYKKIYEDYKSLVDVMLGSYMEDLGITVEQFDEACNRKATEMKTKFHKLQFEQLWAADDFDMFKRMMTRTNIELQLQALELLQHRHGMIPASFLPVDGDASEEEKRVLEEVIKRSLEDQKKEEAAMDKETKELEKALVRTGQTKQQLQAGRDREQELIRSTMKMSVSEVPPVTTPTGGGNGDNKISPEEIKKRQEYLRQQRDKLLSLKRSEREKLLEAQQKTDAANRPKSSRAARSAMAGKIDAKTMEMRKSLAQALRREVVNKK